MTPKGDSRSLATFPKVYPQGSHKYGEDGRLQGWVNVPAVWRGRRVGCEYLRVLPLGSWSSFATNVTMGTRCSPTWNTPFSSHKVTDNSPPPPFPACPPAALFVSQSLLSDIILLLFVFHFNGNVKQALPYMAVYPSCI